MMKDVDERPCTSLVDSSTQQDRVEEGFQAE